MKFDTRLFDEALEAQRERLDQERIRLLNRAADALRGIRQACGIQEAYVVGSLLFACRWHRSSDIDVAVGGCSEKVLAVMKALEDATGKAVDVIDLDAHPFPDAVRKKGMKIYG